MHPQSITTSAAQLCHQVMADPGADTVHRSLAAQLLSFVESVKSDREQDPFYIDCIRDLALEITGQSL